MESPGAASFRTATGEAYDRFMGRYSIPLAARFADAAGVVGGQRALDVGCGPGALTAELVRRLGAPAVAAVDPAPSFVDAVRVRCSGVDARAGRAEALPFEDHRFDVVLAQLVLHFVPDPVAGAAEMRRVVRPGGAVGATVWEFAGGMEMLRAFWGAALALDPAAPDEARALRFGREGEIAALFSDAGLVDVVETALDVRSTYADFDELWSGFLAGIGPAGSYCAALSEERRVALRAELHRRLGSPGGSFTLGGRAWCAVARAPR